MIGKLTAKAYAGKPSPFGNLHNLQPDKVSEEGDFKCADERDQIPGRIGHQ